MEFSEGLLLELVEEVEIFGLELFEERDYLGVALGELVLLLEDVLGDAGFLEVDGGELFGDVVFEVVDLGDEVF